MIEAIDARKHALGSRAAMRSKAKLRKL